MHFGIWRSLWLSAVSGLVLVGTSFGGEPTSSRRNSAPPVPPAEQVLDVRRLEEPSAEPPEFSIPDEVVVTPALEPAVSPAPEIEFSTGNDVPLWEGHQVATSECGEPLFSDCCCPVWTIRAGAVFLRRDNQDDVLLASGATPISAGDLDFDYTAGPLITVIRHGALRGAWDLDFTYFGVNNLEASASTPGSASFFSTPTINYGPRTVTVNYESRLHSTELNLRRGWSDWLAVLAGVRWVEVSDHLATDFFGASHTVNVNNHLYGFQIGADAVVWRRNAFSVETFGKAGIYSNVADQSTDVVGVGGAVPTFSSGDSRVAFVGDLAVTGVYDVTDRLSLRGGYQVLWLDGIALAPDQLAASNVVSGASTLDTSGHPIYHGFTLAAQYWW